MQCQHFKTLNDRNPGSAAGTTSRPAATTNNDDTEQRVSGGTPTPQGEGEVQEKGTRQDARQSTVGSTKKAPENDKM